MALRDGSVLTEKQRDALLSTSALDEETARSLRLHHTPGFMSGSTRRTHHSSNEEDDDFSPRSDVVPGLLAEDQFGTLNELEENHASGDRGHDHPMMRGLPHKYSSNTEDVEEESTPLSTKAKPFDQAAIKSFIDQNGDEIPRDKLVVGQAVQIRLENGEKLHVNHAFLLEAAVEVEAGGEGNKSINSAGVQTYGTMGANGITITVY